MKSVNFKDGTLRAPASYMRARGHELCSRIREGSDELFYSYLEDYGTFGEAMEARVRSDYVNWASVHELFDGRS